MQSLLITTNAFSSNPARGEVYFIQHHVIKFVSDLQQIDGFTPGIPDPSTNKTDRDNIAEILLKVAFNTVNQTLKALKSILSLLYR